MTIEEQLEQIRQQHQQSGGATIGDGMKTSAKAAAWLGGIALVLQSAPFILGILGGGFLLFRGCLPSSTQPNRHVVQPSITNAPMPPASYQQSPTYSQGGNHQAYHSQQPQNANNQHSFFRFNQPEPLTPIDPSPPVALEPNRRAFTDLLSDPNSTPVMQHEGNPLYSMQQGGVFEGFSQMPGKPSVRCTLTVHTIRDDGRYVGCELSTNDRPRISKELEGVIEGEPSKLVLRPKVERGRMPFPNLYSAWHETNLPSRVTLAFSQDGKLLFGEGANREIFEFTPKANAATKQSSLIQYADYKWRMLKQNGEPMGGNHWQFQPKDSRGGTFTWHADGAVRMQGTYRQDIEKGYLDLTLKGEKQPFRGLFYPTELNGGVVRLCLSKKRGGRRPAEISAEHGHLFQFEIAIEESHE